MFGLLLTIILFSSTINCESVTLDCQYPATSQSLDVCKVAHIDGDFSNKDVVFKPRVGKPDEIKIKHVHLGRIPESIMKDHSNIKELKIKNGSVYSLEGVNQLKELEELELPHNNLSEISEYHFDNPLLVEIALDNNQIETVHPNAFKNTPLLKKLDLGDNKIRSLSQSVLVPSLETIDLEDNLLESIDNLFNGNQNIKRIDLKGNLIQKITSNAFADCPSLFKINLSFNKIETVEKGAFDHLESLQWLQLHYNKLKVFQINIINEFMGNLNINDNKLTELSVKLSVPKLKRKFSLEAQRNRLTSVDIPKTIFYNKLKLSDNLLNQLPIEGIKSINFLHLDNVDLSTFDLTPISELTDLTTLSLNGTNIGPDVVKLFFQHPTVQLIDVSYNPKLSNFDFAQITNGAPNLESIYITDCGISQVNANAVKNAFPKLTQFKVIGATIDYERAKRIEAAIVQRGTPEF